MREFIKNTLVKLYSTVPTDKYGQVGQHNLVPHIFGDKASEVMEYCKASKILRFGTYSGSSIGTYTAFTIEDADIRKACSQALQQNQTYIRNINSY